MKPALPIVTIALALLSSAAHADEKADAILKEVRLRMSKVTTYSVTIVLEDSKEKLSMRFLMQRPDKFRMDFFDKGATRVVVLNGDKGALYEKGKMTSVSAQLVRRQVDPMVVLVSGNFERMLEGVKSTTYVTQKMLDEKTVVDVIDIIGKRPGDSARVYIDNNSQIQKIVGKSTSSQGTIYFVSPIADTPIAESTFVIK